MRAPTTPVICIMCNKELAGSETPEGFRVRRHRDTATGQHCRGVSRLDHQPVVVFRYEALAGRPEALADRVDAVTQRFIEIVRDRVR
jgi:hypothetical protein